MAKQTRQREKCTAPGGGGGNRLGTQESEDELAAGQVCVLTSRRNAPLAPGAHRKPSNNLMSSHRGCQGHLMQGLIPEVGSKAFFLFSVVCQLTLLNFFVS